MVSALSFAARETLRLYAVGQHEYRRVTEATSSSTIDEMLDSSKHLSAAAATSTCSTTDVLNFLSSSRRTEMLRDSMHGLTADVRRDVCFCSISL